MATLWYFADPMCSWCWGFAPVLEQIKEQYGERIKIALMLGGLRPGTTEPMTPESREEILHHWRNVHQMTGQEFNFENPMPEDFIYDTEPACRAVITVSEIHADHTLPFFKRLQEAFYREQRNVADVAVLTELAGEFSVEPGDFVSRFDSDELRNKTASHFQHTRQAEVRGFPTLVISKGKAFKMLAHGYRPYEDIRQEIEQWLNEHPANETRDEK